MPLEQSCECQFGWLSAPGCKPFQELTIRQIPDSPQVEEGSELSPDGSLRSNRHKFAPVQIPDPVHSHDRNAAEGADRSNFLGKTEIEQFSEGLQGQSSEVSWAAASGWPQPPSGVGSVDSMQRPAGRGQGVDPTLDLRILFEWRSVLGLNGRVDDEWTATAPVLLVDERIDAFDVCRGIGASECNPKEVPKIPGRELAVIDNHDQRERANGIIRLEPGAERGSLVPAPCEFRSLNHEYSRHCQAWMGKAVGEPHFGAELNGQLPALRAGDCHHDLRALVQLLTRIIQRVDRGPRLEM